MKKTVRSGLALLLTAVLTLGSANLTVRAADTVIVNTGDDSVAEDGLISLREAASMAGYGGTVEFSPELNGSMIEIYSPIRVDQDLTIRMSGQTLNARYDPAVGESDPLSVFIVENGSSLTLCGRGAVEPAVKASPEALAPDRCAVYVRDGGSLTVKDELDISAPENDYESFLIGLAGNSSLSLLDSCSVSSGAFGVKTLNGSSGHTVLIDTTDLSHRGPRCP